MSIALAAAIKVCAPGIEPRLAASLIKQESNFNPYAIGMDGKATLPQQPRTFDEAVATADRLIRAGKTFSVGLAQIHISNVYRYHLTWQQAFDPCTNLTYSQGILQHFYDLAVKTGYTQSDAVYAALRGYNSGDVRNTVSNGYASAILHRLATGDPSAALGITYTATPSNTVLNAPTGMPDMFATPPDLASTSPPTSDANKAVAQGPAVLKVLATTAQSWGVSRAAESSPTTLEGSGWKSASMFDQ